MYADFQIFAKILGIYNNFDQEQKHEYQGGNPPSTPNFDNLPYLSPRVGWHFFR